MKRVLAMAHTAALAPLGRRPSVLGFDFDGTLAPIVAERDAAQMRASTAALFTRVCALYPCAVISGRSRDDVTGRLGAAQPKYIIGNHGLEMGGELGDFEREVARARELLAGALADVAGVDVEDKRYSLAIHYRMAPHRARAREAIHAAVGALPVRLRTVGGKLVVNAVCAHAPHKGDALLHVRASEKAEVALFVGDDVTDEDAFALDRDGRVVSVRVGASRTSAASYCLRDQREIDELLARLIALRS